LQAAMNYLQNKCTIFAASLNVRFVMYRVITYMLSRMLLAL